MGKIDGLHSLYHKATPDQTAMKHLELRPGSRHQESGADLEPEREQSP